MKDSIRKKLYFFVLLLPILPVLFAGNNFIYPAQSPYSDLTISHLSNAIYLRNWVQGGQDLPFWSGLIMSGAPFAADPLSGLWYLPGWFALIFPLPLGFNLSMAFHLFWFGLGMYFLLRKMYVKMFPALMGALVLECYPKIFSHLAAGHLTLIYAIAWTPWLLLLEVTYWKKQLSVGKQLLAGAVLGMILLADVRWAAYACIAWIGMSVYLAIQMGWKRWTKEIFWKAANILLALFIAAPLLLPLIEWINLSSRQLMTTADVLAFSLPPEKLLGLWIPDPGGYQEWILYGGGIAFVLMVYGLVNRSIRKKVWFWLVCYLVCLLFSLGKSLPGMEWIAGLPGISFLRVPPRMMFLGGMVQTILLAFIIDEWSKLRFDLTPNPFIVAIPLTAFVDFILIGMIGMGVKPGTNFLWAAVFWNITAIWIGLLRHQKVSSKMWGMVMAVLVLVDLMGVNILSIQYIPSMKIYTEGQLTAETVLKNRTNNLQRSYSPSYSIPQHQAAKMGLQFVDGINPMQINAYSQSFPTISGVQNSVYSVTEPAFKTGTPEVDNEGICPDINWLRLLAVDSVVTAFPLDECGLGQGQAIESGWLYRIENPLPRAWLQNRLVQAGEGEIIPAQVEWFPNQIKVIVEGEGLLVLSEIDYPGWKVSDNGTEVERVLVEGLLRGVLLSPGLHTVLWTYSPWQIPVGIGLSILGWLCVFILNFHFKWGRHEKNSELIK